jgi:hypothetical protein
MNQVVSVYRMNPVEDEIRFGDEIAEGMWVLCEDPSLRSPHGSGEDDKIRAQRFRRVTRLRRQAAIGGTPAQVVFVGEWVDGYQEVHRYAETFGWLVKKADPAEVEPDDASSES